MTPQPLDPAATEALLAFWRDAGVDACYLDATVDRTVFVAPPAPQTLGGAKEIIPLSEDEKQLAMALGERLAHRCPFTT